MTLVDFPECNSHFVAPEGMAESQVQTAPAFVGQVERGSVEGASIVVVAWKPSLEDLEILKRDGLIYLSVLGGLPPHYLSTDFHSATHPE